VTAERGRRICVPDPEGDGDDVRLWLESLVPDAIRGQAIPTK
jgi:hypothetical protein